jgi:hypothetical protein
MFAQVNGEWDGLDDGPVPWGIWDFENDVTPDFGYDDVDGTETGHDNFSKTPCEGCGSVLAGDRYQFAWWG